MTRLMPPLVLAVVLLVAVPATGVAATDLNPIGPERGDSTSDTRLVLQLGMLFALLYVAFVCVWLSRSRSGRGLRHAVRRLVTSRRRRPTGRRAAGGGPWTCMIAWKPGQRRSRFQAVTAAPGDGTRRVVAESASLRWPPKDVRHPPTDALEAALGQLVDRLMAAGWEPIETKGGSWSERRFVWRGPGEPPAKLRPVEGAAWPRPADWPAGPAAQRSPMPAGWIPSPGAGTGERGARHR